MLDPASIHLRVYLGQAMQKDHHIGGVRFGFIGNEQCEAVGFLVFADEQDVVVLVVLSAGAAVGLRGRGAAFDCGVVLAGRLPKTTREGREAQCRDKSSPDRFVLCDEFHSHLTLS